MSRIRFPNIDWWCDRCGAYLNDQVGFSDSHYIWQCTECGHKNSISLSNIYPDKDEFQKYQDNNDSSYGVAEQFADNIGIAIGTILSSLIMAGASKLYRKYKDSKKDKSK